MFVGTAVFCLKTAFSGLAADVLRCRNFIENYGGSDSRAQRCTCPACGMVTQVSAAALRSCVPAPRCR